MKSTKTLKAGLQRARNEVAKAEREIARLQRELKAGTLDRRKLELGLKKLKRTVCQIPDHVPPFSKEA